ncbi:hypothetical protein [Maribacter polysaccharolyticus]|uniref:hypothetical protein n=1 Tax=Maribacter polysaccharolyticus TaxID=3020831 RepID=UPI00237F4F6B|nr:hypothetical protein [Maribacter polysaccharolyticus]MDE3741479.1 hypothetical protein [Maribacter polysaccharolyticus]
MMKLLFENKVNGIMGVLFFIGVFLVFFLSWKTDPNLKGTPLIPEWLSDWTDNVHNDRRRTGVPFIGLGLLAGMYLIYIKRTKVFYWGLVWFVLGFVVVIAEAVQYFLPSRSMDLKDIFWGGVGSTIGLGLPFVVWYSIKTFKRNSHWK